jgi:hypothetical protein
VCFMLKDEHSNGRRLGASSIRLPTLFACVPLTLLTKDLLTLLEALCTQAQWCVPCSELSVLFRGDVVAWRGRGSGGSPTSECRCWGLCLEAAWRCRTRPLC